jgi:hypothetical protein
MVTANQTPAITENPARTGARLLVLLASMSPEQSEAVLNNLTAAFPAEDLIVASPDALASDSHPELRFVAAPGANAPWTLTASDFLNAHHLAEANAAQAVLFLSPGSASLNPSALHDLANAVLSSQVDLALSCYTLPPHAGLVNSAILYPLTRALFASSVRFPLAIDLGLSLRLAERLATAAHRFTTSGEGDTPLCTVNEAKVAGFNLSQFNVGVPVLSQSSGPGLNAVFPTITSALFSDIEAKAAFWQRFRPVPPSSDAIPAPPESGSEVPPELGPMIQAFRLAYTNLQEIWSLVLPPNSLLGLKRLSTAEAPAFRISESLWTRIVYDFLLAYRLRTINRGHLLGALIPLYLAWVASHINLTASGTNPESHIEAVAAAFEAEKPYLVSRWRWPDRFNP